MLEFYEKYKRDVYSQNGEDGIIEEIVRRCEIKPGTAIEFGGADGDYCSNIRNLEKSGWRIIQYDINPSGPVIYKEITEENVNEIGDCNILSIDIDGKDYQVFKAYKGRPDIIIIEINSSLPPLDDYSDEFLGCNYSKMVKLGAQKGYFTLCHTGNVVLVDFKHYILFPEVHDSSPLDINKRFNKSWL